MVCVVSYQLNYSNHHLSILFASSAPCPHSTGGDRCAAGGYYDNGQCHSENHTSLLLRTMATLQWQVMGISSFFSWFFLLFSKRRALFHFQKDPWNNGEHFTRFHFWSRKRGTWIKEKRVLKMQQTPKGFPILELPQRTCLENIVHV